MNALQTEEDVFWTEFISDRERKTLQAFRAQLEGGGNLVEGQQEDVDLLRFLKARDFNIADAELQYVNMKKWREENKVDEINENFNFPELPAVRACYPHFYHKTDKFHRPLYIEVLGEMDTAELLNVTTLERFVRYHIWAFERLRTTKFKVCSELAGRPVLTCCTILDLKGLGLKHFTSHVQRFLRTVSQIDQDYYPECLGQMFIINAPSIFSFIWRIVSPWLQPRTQKKIKVLGAQYTDVLLEVIPKDSLPEMFGGLSVVPSLDSEIGPWGGLDKKASAPKQEENGDHIRPAVDVQ